MMPRSRTVGNGKLPKYVYRVRGWYVYREYLGRADGKTQFAPDRKLCRDCDPLTEVWRAYREEISRAERKSLSWLFDEFIASNRYEDLSERSREAYARNALVINRTKMKNGKLFGDVLLSSITPGALRKYMDRRSRTAPVEANRELSFIKTALAWALERDMIDSNPAASVKKNKEKARDRYVTDAEYQVVYDLATDQLRCAMEIAYLCRARLKEIRFLQKSHMTDDGLLLKRIKGSKTQLIGWTPRLRAAANAGLRQGKVSALDPYILHRRDGAQLKHSGFQSAWQRLMRKAEKHGLSDRFTFHDLKAKGVSDFDGDKTKASGHKSARMTAIYDRKTETIDATR